MTNETINEGALPASAPAPQPEKFLSQSEVNTLIGAAKQKGQEKGYQQRDAELSQQAATQPAANNQPPNAGIPDESRFRQIAQDEFTRQQQAYTVQQQQQQKMQWANQIITDLKSKVPAAQSKYDDFDKVVDPEFNNFQHTAQVLKYANQFDNPGDILYDLAKNPAKALNIQLMDANGMSQQAFSEVKKLSDSIKMNEMAASQPKAKAPLSQITPSTVGVGNTDGDSLSGQFRGKY